MFGEETPGRTSSQRSMRLRATAFAAALATFPALATLHPTFAALGGTLGGPVHHTVGRTLFHLDHLVLGATESA